LRTLQVQNLPEHTSNVVSGVAVLYEHDVEPIHVRHAAQYGSVGLVSVR